MSDNTLESKVLATIRIVGLEFSEVTDDEILRWIPLCKSYVAKSKFADDYYQALSLIVCHRMKMAGYGDTSLGSLAETARLSGISEGGVSVSFAATPSTAGSGDPDAEFRMTTYGLQYLTLRNHYRASIVVSGMR